MSAVVDLFPKARPSRHYALESAVEAVEMLGTFTISDVFEHVRPRWLGISRYGAAREVVQVLEREGLIRRVTPPGRRPTTWTVTR